MMPLWNIRAEQCSECARLAQKQIMTTLITVLLLLSSVGASQQLTSQPTPSGKLIDLGGYRLHLNCTGNKGPTVVLIAGAGDFSFDWSLVQPNIAAVCARLQL